MKSSISRDRSLDPTPRLSSTLETVLDPKPPTKTEPRFRVGDLVIEAESWANKTGVRPHNAAHPVVDIEWNWTSDGWHVVIFSRYHHECRFVLLEHIDDWTPANDPIRGWHWIRINSHHGLLP